MISFRDRTFCPFWEDCEKSSECPRPLTPEVIAAAEMWWGASDAPIAQFLDKPECHSRR